MSATPSSPARPPPGPGPAQSSAPSPFALAIITAALFRLSLSLTSLPQLLQDRNELATPITAFARLKEGYHMYANLGLNPYKGGSFHQAPLLLLLGPALEAADPIAVDLVWTAAEVATACLLASVAEGRKRGVIKGEGEKVWRGWVVALIYLLHPFGIATQVARSTIVFSNLFVALAVASALSGATLSAAFALSLATHISLYPVLLLPPLIVLAARSTPSGPHAVARTAAIAAAAFVAHHALVLALSRWIAGSCEFIESVYGVILTYPDLTPNIGLGWYFFIEMFDHFRSFFVCVFQLHVLAYVAPLTIAFAHEPLFATTLLVGIIALFKSYPQLGDFALWHALLACYSELGAHISHGMFYACLTLYSLCLLPAFHHLWLYSGAGNANFFYASTLVWAISQGGLLNEVLSAWGRREVLRGLGEAGRGKVREEKWRVVQR